MIHDLDIEQIRFGICITNAEPDLELRKLYKLLPDDHAAQNNYVRVIDESREDYLYPADYFVLIDATLEKERTLLLAS